MYVKLKYSLPTRTIMGDKTKRDPENIKDAHHPFIKSKAREIYALNFSLDPFIIVKISSHHSSSHIFLDTRLSRATNKSSIDRRRRSKISKTRQIDDMPIGNGVRTSRHRF